MGGWFGKCCGESSNQNEDPNERTVLIDEHSETIPTEPDNEPSLPYRGATPIKPDEHSSAMNKILSETATNVIDVAALGPHTMEQNDFLDRKELYATLLRPHLAAPWVHGGQQKCILLDIPDPEQVFCAPPVSTVEYCLLEKISADVARALECLSVHHKEELIVPFQIP